MPVETKRRPPSGPFAELTVDLNRYTRAEPDPRFPHLSSVPSFIRLGADLKDAGFYLLTDNPPVLAPPFKMDPTMDPYVVTFRQWRPTRHKK